mmetsp:Transcript_13193/g.9259  ORF Transcript_13193/g.9259 Transcript_13193/m.9259 type:complete len:84 (-) Transcript_13193:614-865(-)
MARQADKLQAVVKDLSQYGPCMWMQGDVRNNEHCLAAIESTIKHYGRLDILVNGAAGNFLATAEKLSANGFKAVMSIDANGAF